MQMLAAAATQLLRRGGDGNVAADARTLGRGGDADARSRRRRGVVGRLRSTRCDEAASRHSALREIQETRWADCGPSARTAAWQRLQSRRRHALWHAPDQTMRAVSTLL